MAKETTFRIGMVGIGAMGCHIATRLRRAGFLATAFDVEEARARSVADGRLAAPDQGLGELDVSVVARGEPIAVVASGSSRRGSQSDG